jgi:small subunit ribosomal protein S4
MIAEVLSTRRAPDWLLVEPAEMSGRIVMAPSRDQMDIPPVNEQLVVEFYSR